MTTSEADTEFLAFLVMAEKLRAAMSERDELVRPFRERYDRSQDDLRMPPPKQVRFAEELVRAACKADHVYEERVEGSLEQYRRVTTSEEASRY